MSISSNDWNRRRFLWAIVTAWFLWTMERPNQQVIGAAGYFDLVLCHILCHFGHFEPNFFYVWKRPRYNTLFFICIICYFVHASGNVLYVLVRKSFHFQQSAQFPVILKAFFHLLEVFPVPNQNSFLMGWSATVCWTQLVACQTLDVFAPLYY